MTTMSPLISAQALRDRMARPAGDLLVLDTRFSLADVQAGERAYAQGHLPGALYAHLDRDLSGPKTGHNGRHPLPSPAAFLATLCSWGLTPETHVVAYDDAGGMFAARLWWMLRWLGFERVQVLDGGWQAWLASGGQTDQTVPTRPGSTLTLHERPGRLVLADEVLAHLDSGAQCLIDARSPDRFRGENETLDPVGGHIPGARNRFFQLNLQPDGRFKPAEVLRDEFEAVLNGAPAASVVHQCGSGVTACHNILAMTLAGWPDTRLYAGSWSEWCAHPARPVAR
jgi:thiosulfate/3-mercaptopyruvate sulfurtransferase